MNYNSSTANIEKDNILSDLFDKKWSQWSISDDDVPAEIILEIFDTARNATSNYNYKEQAWIGLMANRKDEKFTQLLNCLDNFNLKNVEAAPCLGVISEKKNYNHKGKEKINNFYNTEVFFESASQKAASMGYILHLMSGFSVKTIKRDFDVQKDYEPKLMFAIGKYNCDISRLNEDNLLDEIEREIQQNNN